MSGDCLRIVGNLAAAQSIGKKPYRLIPTGLTLQALPRSWRPRGLPSAQDIWSGRSKWSRIVRAHEFYTIVLFRRPIAEAVTNVA